MLVPLMPSQMAACVCVFTSDGKLDKKGKPGQGSQEQESLVKLIGHGIIWGKIYLDASNLSAIGHHICSVTNIGALSASFLSLYRVMLMLLSTCNYFLYSFLYSDIFLFL